MAQREATRGEEASARSGVLDRWFKLAERGTDLRTEIMAGVTVFMTMSYIIFVSPNILADAGVPQQAAFGATIYASAFASILMGLWANFPVALAPGLGLNTFFAYTVVLGEGLSWQTALGAVFISGIVFVVLTVTGIRELLMDGVPPVMKYSVGAGIGLFIAFIGLQNAGLVVADDANFVTMGDLSQTGPLLALLGLAVSAMLLVRRFKGAFIVGILATTLVAMAVGFAQAPNSVGDVVSFSLPSVSETFLAMDLAGALGYGIISIIFTFTVVEVFDNLATFIGLTRRAGLMDEDGRVPGLRKAFTADASGILASASLGNTAMNAYIENATGIEQGGRTGIQALVVAAGFLLALLFAPFVGLIPAEATAPVLVLVGALMLSEIQYVSFDDYTDVIPAFLTVFMMPVTFSIAEGLAFGFVSYVLLKVVSGKFREVHWITYFISAAFIVNFWMLGH